MRALGNLPSVVQVDMVTVLHLVDRGPAQNQAGMVPDQNQVGMVPGRNRVDMAEGSRHQFYRPLVDKARTEHNRLQVQMEHS